MRRLLTLWAPQGFTGQITLILIVAIMLAQSLVIALFATFRSSGDAAHSPPAIGMRIATIARMADRLPAESRLVLLGAANGDQLSIVTASNFAAIPRSMQPPPGPILRQLLGDEKGLPLKRLAPSAGNDGSRKIAIGLHDGSALIFTVAADAAHPPPPFVRPELIAVIAFVAFSIAILSIWAARRVIAPLAAFAGAAERLGLEGSVEPLAEEGPQEIRQAARAFNLMQARIRRFIEDRTRMLAAISHDLRSPITRLQLRAEAVEDLEERSKMLQDLQRMEAMVASALAFIRENRAEAFESVDFASLLQTLCDDASDAGFAIAYEGPSHVVLRCQPQALGRAFGNVIENAIKFGTSAKVSLIEEDGCMTVDIDDDGPGIPEDEREKVFEPFYRVDKARGADLGGVGLGLSIARAVVHAHGGEISLQNLSPRGTRVHIVLPRSNALA